MRMMKNSYLQFLLIALFTMCLDGCSDDPASTNGGDANHAPVAVDDSYTVESGGDLIVTTANGVLANDTDADSDALTCALGDGCQHGSLAIEPNGSFGYYSYTNFTGIDTFTYYVSDGNGGTDTGTVTITVTEAGINNAPVAVDDGYSLEGGGELTVTVDDGVLANDTDADGDALTSAVITDCQNGTLVLDTDGSFSYNPISEFCGVDTFTYQASDGNGGADTATVAVAVSLGPTTIGGGTIDQDSTWTLCYSPYIVTGDIYVDGGTLTIEPGVVVKFQSGSGINIGYHGTGSALIADGTAISPIVFTSAHPTPAGGDWDAIRFYSGTLTTSKLSNCTIEYGS
ncbi:MAG: cadherin-like domain-containing protein, partial [candidate division Zixibacteria bacterium]|nr:cadherin-like domain-containing protein [candidate division Zixibacteria bacterium]